ncbi:Tol-Pal system beta propeller repeat protein TolB [Paucibacter sp. Y2R2-4]|uniref:Tol-Pal system beta propeller repeat protein TolB n=1 Tax=Paucibacter sp. Y2R2-4 TaxID=2893553 RepID=UPI0021E4EF0C|nr:Tol-Pal system beta propeller repeat protein TolB [Paucibacter sp. Y2R2-4]MCV2351922.1 Tol-Pal system beta propeller repeat protein TolB [Paucibacter sp. Y2R2-4]
MSAQNTTPLQFESVRGEGLGAQAQARRSVLIRGASAVGAWAGLAGLSTPAWAQFRVEISGVGATQLPIALPEFRDESRAGQAVASIIRSDLERSGKFRIIDAPQSGLFEGSQPTWSDWRGRNADALAAGSASRLADGRVDLRYKLWDVVKGQDLGGEAHAVAPDDVRLAAHRIADTIYQKLTGEPGVFATRMAYVTKAGGRYSLRITDADGEGGQVALASPDPIISPAWSPNGRELVYVSFETRKAVVWIQDVSTGKRRALADFRGTNSAPAFSPDGQQLSLTLSREGGSQLFIINRDGSGLRRLTQSSAIDTESVFSPDGRSLYFVSDRGGSPQIYRMSVAGGAAERVTFNGAYNISPAISPDGRTMAFITRLNGGTFRLCVMDLASGTVQQISDGNDDESPSFAPNGRLLVYASRSAGRDVLMTTTLDGRIKAKLISTLADVREPTWGPFGR